MTATRNLGQTEAERRAGLLSVDSYEISVDLTDGSGGAAPDRFRSTTTVSFGCREPGADTFIEAAAERIHRAELNGAPIDTSAWSPAEGLALVDLAAHNVLTVEADFEYCPDEQGLHRAVDPADGAVYLYTQFEPADAQRVFACFDQPDLKAPFTWRVTVPAGWTAVSNMPVEREEPGPGGARTLHFARSVAMSTYITALCAGPFHQVRGEHDGIDLGLYCRASLAPYLEADFLFEVTRQGLDFFARNFGVRYPLPAYNQVFIPEYMGAMENFGCVTYSDAAALPRTPPTDALRLRVATVMLHEIAHMWFGDLVTMRWWNDLWLNESFATWAASWALAGATRFADTAWPAFLNQWKVLGYEGDQLSSTHPVQASIPDVEAVKLNFDRITYGKGAAVLKQLVAYVGSEAFLAGLRAYFDRHAYANTTLDDLLSALGSASGKDVPAFAAQWLRTAQVNTLRAEVSVGDDGGYTGVAVTQQAPNAHPTLRTHRMNIGLFDLDGERLVRRGRVPVEVTGERTEVPELTGARAADLLLLNDDDLTYAKLRLDGRSTRTALNHLAAVPELLARTLCCATLWDMVRDGELPARRYVAAVASALPVETDLALLTAMLQYARTALTYYADPRWAPVGWRRLVEVARAGLDAAPPASDAQQIWARAYAALARDEPDLAVLAGWLRGDGVPAGLALRAELRWAVLHGLAANAAAGPAQIEAEQRGDRTTNGDEAAATARALLPTAEAKADAWRRVTDPATGMHLRRALLQGFEHPAQTALTAPYAARYLDMLERAWREWESLPARSFAVQAYPTQQVDERTVAAVGEWLRGDRPATLRRLVGDRHEDAVRALRARARDAAADNAGTGDGDGADGDTGVTSATAAAAPPAGG
jgi:aminopeptidase N